MPKLHMTDVVVTRLKFNGTYYDETTPAFGLRVGKNRKTWFVVRGRERLRTNIGQYPATSLADARKEARKLLTEEPTKADRITFNAAYELFKEALKSKKERTQYDYKRVLDKYIEPKLCSKKLSDISYEDITKITDPLARSEKRNTLAVARTFFRWCVRPPRKYLKHSPLEGVEIPKAGKRKRILNDEELITVWHATVRQGYPHGTVCQLLALTGQREGEIANLRRPWINEKEQTITLPEWLTKNSKEHTFPYGNMVAEILEGIPRRNDTDLLFPCRISLERPISGWSKFKKELDDGVPNWTLHDFRRTYRSIHGQIGTPSDIAERLINHAAAVQTEVEALYDRWHYLPQMRQAILAYEEHFKALLAGDLVHGPEYPATGSSIAAAVHTQAYCY
jgi:integrase